MAKGILLVQSRPASPDEADTYHRWYDETHIPEILAVAGFTSARRLRSADDESYVVVYEVDDVDKAKAAMADAAATMSPPAGVLLDPPPTVQWLTDLADGST
jgi:hypothetical protein